MSKNTTTFEIKEGVLLGPNPNLGVKSISSMDLTLRSVLGTLKICKKDTLPLWIIEHKGKLVGGASLALDEDGNEVFKVNIDGKTLDAYGDIIPHRVKQLAETAMYWLKGGDPDVITWLDRIAIVLETSRISIDYRNDTMTDSTNQFKGSPELIERWEARPPIYAQYFT